jgi:hypothetical protein
MPAPAGPTHPDARRPARVEGPDCVLVSDLTFIGIQMPDELERLVEEARLVATVRTGVRATIGSPKLLVDYLALRDCAGWLVEVSDACRDCRPAPFGFRLRLNLEGNNDFERQNRFMSRPQNKGGIPWPVTG